MKIHILTENRTKKRGILAEHGLSIFIEHENINILFDTGQTDVYCSNATKMGVDLNKTDYIVLSHGHYDHCGGLIYFPKSNIFPEVYVQKTAFAKKYARNPDGKTNREIGIPWSLNDNRIIKNKIVFTEKNMQIAPNIILCSEIPKIAAFERTSQGLFVEVANNQLSIDTMNDEQMLIYDTTKGLVIFLGCSHPGIINCLNHALKLFPGKKIDTLVAGMHLDGVSLMRLQLTIQQIMELDIKKIIPLHCTGIFAISEMKHILKNRCLTLCAGDSVTLN